MLHQESVPSRVPDGVVAGTMILAVGLLSIAVISHHPVVHSHTPEQLLHDVAASSTMDEIVHGTLIAFMLALAFGFSVFALRQGMHRQTSVAGLLSYLVGAAALSGAGLIDGFFTPLVAAANANASGAALTGVITVLAGGAAMIQVLTAFGFTAMSLGILLWSIGMLVTAGAVRYAGLAGLVAAIVPVIIVASTHRIAVATLMIIVLVQAVWYAAVGVLMIRRVL